MDDSAEQKISGFLRQYGWTFEEKGKGFWVTGWTGKYRVYTLQISETSSLLRFCVASFFVAKMTDQYRLMAVVGDINRRVPMIKVVVDDKQNVNATVDMWAKFTKYKEFEYVLSLFGHYLDTLFEELSMCVSGISCMPESGQRFLT